MLVVDDTVAWAFKENLKDSPEVRIWVPAKNRLRYFTDIANMLAHRAYFLVQNTLQIFRARRAGCLRSVPAGAIVIFAWLTRENLRSSEDFYKSFYGDLVSSLEAMGHRVVISPIVLRDVPYSAALECLKAMDTPTLVPHRFLRFIDLVRLIGVSIARPPMPPDPLIEQMDVSVLFQEEHRRHWTSNQSVEALITSYLIKRWNKSGLSISRFIYVFENQPSERAICWEARTSFPDAPVIGYQHAGIPGMLLNLHLAPKGEPDAPLPDRIVTVGAHTARKMTDNGHDPSRVQVGGALQMQELLGQRQATTRPMELPPETPILVASSDSAEEAAELVYLAGKLHQENPGIPIVMKCHPRMPYELINRLTGITLTDESILTEEPMVDLLSNCSAMVYSGSTVAIQALAFGMPAIHLRTQFDLDLDPLDSAKHLRLEATGLDELRERIDWVLANREEYVQQNRDTWNRFIEEFYGPVSEDTFRAFVEPNTVV